MFGREFLVTFSLSWAALPKGLPCSRSTLLERSPRCYGAVRWRLELLRGALRPPGARELRLKLRVAHVTSVKLINLASLLLLLLSELAAAPATEPAFAAACGGDASLSLLVVARMAVVCVQLQAAARCQQRRRR